MNNRPHIDTCDIVLSWTNLRKSVIFFLKRNSLCFSMGGKGGGVREGVLNKHKLSLKKAVYDNP